jgi:hypothetical protein
MEALTRYRLPRSVPAASDYLAEVALTVTLLRLFRTTFPPEWQESSVLTGTATQAACWNLVNRFLELVDGRLFPIGYEEWEMSLSDLTYIPFASHDVNFWEGIDDFEGGERLLLELYAGNPDGYLPVPVAETINWQLLYTRCQQLSPPLSYLADALSVIDHSTGSTWLDATPDAGFCFQWNEEDLEYLANQWQLAREFRQKYEALIEWIEANRAHEKQVIDLWNSATG